jgi:hypothetical protein
MVYDHVRDHVRDASEPLVAPSSWLRSCCLPPRSAIRAPLVVQSLLSTTHMIAHVIVNHASTS